MILKILHFIHRNSTGFTLIEMIVTVAISSLVISGTVLSLHQVVFGGGNVKEDMTATQYVQNSGKWIRQDTLMSQSIVSGDNPSTAEIETMTLFWTGASYRDAQDNDRIDYCEVSYFLDGDKLRRKEFVTTEIYNTSGSLIDTIEDTQMAMVSDNIVDFTIISENVSLAVSVTALVGDYEAEKTYEILPRAALLE